jgi:hypothetical protein
MFGEWQDALFLGIVQEIRAKWVLDALTPRWAHPAP